MCAQAGLTTQLHDAFPAGLAKGGAAIEAFWAKGIARGKTQASDVATWRSHLTLQPDLALAVTDADVVIEAVPERLELKTRIFAELDRLAPAHAILGTNTSGLSIAAIAAATRNPARVIGMHFFNPVPQMPLLELVAPTTTSAATLAAAQELGRRLGKTTIRARDSPGFATSRLGIVLGNEAMRMLEEGVASAADIDTAMRLGYGHPMGPLELSDLVGLDVRLAIGDYLHAQLGGAHYRSPDLVRRLVAAGDVGKKSGKGIYDWSNGMPRERSL